MSLWVDLQNVSENLSTEVWNNFSLVKSMLKEPGMLNFIPLKFKELPTEKCVKGLLFNEIMTIYISSFLCSVSGKCTPFLRWGMETLSSAQTSSLISCSWMPSAFVLYVMAEAKFCTHTRQASLQLCIF